MKNAWNCGTPTMTACPFDVQRVNVYTSSLWGCAMPPDVLLRKLTYLRQLLDDLQPFGNASLAIDYSILHSSIRPALRDFGEFLALVETRLRSK